MVVMRVKVILCLICILQIMACGNSTRSNSEYVPVKDYHTVEVDDKDDMMIPHQTSEVFD